MFYPTLRPRITEFNIISDLVTHLRREGVDDLKMAYRISQIGAVDLDKLQEVMQKH
ncbi:MAG: hypothetical protein L3J32_04575 [Rhizobiaceae bacterium]|nr:hypothetical protein [Rhizobiaceae bacterium]